MKFLKWLTVVIVAATTGACLSLFVDLDWVGNADPTEVEISFSDLAAISMGAAALALGACALIVTLFAAIGVHQIKKEATSLARRSADDEIRARLDAILEKRLKAAIAQKLPKAINDAVYGTDEITDAEVAEDTRENEQ